MDVSPYCSYCLRERDIQVDEDLLHVLCYCSRAFDLYFMLTPTLLRIGGLDILTSTDLIFGRSFHQKSQFICFNLLVHTLQRALWMSKKAYDVGRDFDILEYIFRILKTDIERSRILLSTNNFRTLFCGPQGLVFPHDGHKWALNIEIRE